MLTLGVAASALLVLIQVGDTVRAAYQTLVSLMVIVGFVPFVYIFGSAWKLGHRWSAASGLLVTFLAVAFGLVPTDAIERVWVFELKLALGTFAAVGSGWLIYRRAAVSARR
jgi:hypothetical protein